MGKTAMPMREQQKSSSLYRSGKWPLPSNYVPTLCKRFNSNFLFQVLAASLNESDEIAPLLDDADINETRIREIAKDLVLAGLSHFQLIEGAMTKPDGLTKIDVSKVEESNQRVALKFKYVLTLIEALYERQAALKRKQA